MRGCFDIKGGNTFSSYFKHPCATYNFKLPPIVQLPIAITKV